MRGLDPRIHKKEIIPIFKMDCRVKPGNDDEDRSSQIIVGMMCVSSWSRSAADSKNPAALTRPPGLYVQAWCRYGQICTASPV
jgi:hypothetical protein